MIASVVMTKPCSAATSLHSSSATSAPHAGSDRSRERTFTKVSRGTTLNNLKGSYSGNQHRKETNIRVNSSKNKKLFRLRP